MSTRQLCGGILCAILLASTATAQAPDATPQSSGNAALQYWPAFMFLPRDEADVKTLENWRQAPLDDKTRKLVEGHNYLHAAARMKKCDWGLDMSQGPYLLLPFLNKSRPLTYKTCLRIRFDIAQKKWADAAEDAGDSLVAARYVARPPVMISLLVSFANERDTIDAITPGLNSFDRESLARLTARLDALPPAPSMADSLKLESSMTVDWAVKKVRNAGPNPNWHGVLGFLDIGDEGKPAQKTVEQLVQESGGTAEAVAGKIEALLPFYAEAEKLANASLTQAEFNRQAQELASRYAANPFAKPILPDLARAHDAVIAAQTRMVVLRAAVAVVQNGPDAVKQFTDPGEHQPIAYQARPDGFELTSKVTYRNQPLKLTVGGAR